MHHLSYLAVFPATTLTVAGYVTLYCARNSQGRMQTAGKILAGWTFLLAILVVIVAVAHPAMDHGMIGHHMGEHPRDVDSAIPIPPDAPPPPALPGMTRPAPPPSTGWKTE